MLPASSIHMATFVEVDRSMQCVESPGKNIPHAQSYLQGHTCILLLDLHTEQSCTICCWNIMLADSAEGRVRPSTFVIKTTCQIPCIIWKEAFVIQGVAQQLS